MSFEFEPLEIPDVVLVRTGRHHDLRGFFQETYRRSVFAAAGIRAEFVQDNVTRSSRDVLRGLHYQLPPAAQGKLLGVSSGEIFDVAVDLRAESSTYGRWVGRTLSGALGDLLWIPEGFAHGYAVLSQEADVFYKVTAEYAAHLDRGIRWDDPTIGIDWPLREPTVSPKDRRLPTLALAENTFR